MRRLKIGLFNDSFFPMIDGVVMVVDHYARSMSRYADVTVFAPKMGDYDFDKLPYRTVLSRSVSMRRYDYRIPLANADPAFHRALAAAELDIVHAHSPFFIGKAGIRYARRNAVPSVATLHTQFHLEFDRAVHAEKLTRLAVSRMMRVFDEADEVWTLNERMAELYTVAYGGAKIPVIAQNATDMHPCKDPAAAAAEVNRKYAVRPDERVFLFVGRMDSLKNIPTIICALARLRQQGAPPFKMLFVGSGKDRALYEDEVLKSGLEGHVIFCGRITDREALARIYARADLFLFPSMFDANSLVQIEAAAQSTPALFVRGSVTSASIVDGENGFLCDNSGEALAARIAEILQAPNLLARAGEGAHRDLYRTWEGATQEAYARYLQLVDRRAAETV